jgi:hypothetical protein
MIRRIVLLSCWDHDLDGRAALSASLLAYTCDYPRLPGTTAQEGPLTGHKAMFAEAYQCLLSTGVDYPTKASAEGWPGYANKSRPLPLMRCAKLPWTRHYASTHSRTNLTFAEAYQRGSILAGVGFQDSNESIGEGWPGLLLPAITNLGDTRQSLCVHHPAIMRRSSRKVFVK